MKERFFNTHNVRRLFLLLLICSFVLFIVLLSAFVVVLCVRSGHDSALSINPKTEGYRYVRIDVSKNETSVGFSQLVSEKEVFDYEDDEGIYYYYSKMGSEDEVDFIECSGTCYCSDHEDDSFPEYNFDTRRVPVVRIAISVVLGVASLIGYTKYKTHSIQSFRKKCKILLDDVCKEAFIEAEVEECVQIEKKQEEFGHNNKKVERVVCRGNCLPNKNFFPEGFEASDFEEELGQNEENFFGDDQVDCKELSLTTVFNKKTLKSLETSGSGFSKNYVDCYRNLQQYYSEESSGDGKGSSSYPDDLGPVHGCLFYEEIRDFFAKEFLGRFCLEGGKFETEVVSGTKKGSRLDIYQCEAWKDQAVGSYRMQTNSLIGYVKESRQIDCVIETILE